VKAKEAIRTLAEASEKMQRMLDPHDSGAVMYVAGVSFAAEWLREATSDDAEEVSPDELAEGVMGTVQACAPLVGIIDALAALDGKKLGKDDLAKLASTLKDMA